MAEQSLGNHWKELDGMEEEFVSAFTDFVEHSYMSTLLQFRVAVVELQRIGPAVKIRVAAVVAGLNQTTKHGCTDKTGRASQ